MNFFAKLINITIMFISIGSVSNYAFGEGLIGDDVNSILRPQFLTSTLTPFTTSSVQVVDPGIEFTGELSYSGTSTDSIPRTFSVDVDLFSDYFTVTIEATNEWLTDSGGTVTAFAVGGDASIFEIQMYALNLPGGIDSVTFDPSRSVGFLGTNDIREITWDSVSKQVNIRFSAVRNSVTYAFSLQNANSQDSDGDGVLDGIDECPDEVGEAEYNGCPPPSGEGLIGDDINSILIPQFLTSTLTPFTTSSVQVVDPGIEFTGELSTSNIGPAPFTYNVDVDLFSDYFTVTIEATNEWLSSSGNLTTAFAFGGDTSIFDIQISDLDLPGGIDAVVFDQNRSVGLVSPGNIKEITWDTISKQVNIRFGSIRNSVTFAFSLQNASSLDSDGDGVVNGIDECPDEFGEVAYNGCPAPIDSDGDGVLDDVDECPNEFGETTYNGCPRPLMDSDGDGVLNNVDECPDEFGLIARKGCPKPKPKVGNSRRTTDIAVTRVNHLSIADLFNNLWHVFPSARIENLGSAKASNFKVFFQLGPKTLRTRNTGEVRVESLEPGATMWVFLPRYKNSLPGVRGGSLNIPGGTGTYTLSVIVDKQQVIPETNESNNAYHKQLTFCVFFC